MFEKIGENMIVDFGTVHTYRSDHMIVNSVFASSLWRMANNHYLGSQKLYIMLKQSINGIKGCTTNTKIPKP